MRGDFWKAPVIVRRLGLRDLSSSTAESKALVVEEPCLTDGKVRFVMTVYHGSNDERRTTNAMI